MNARYAMPLPNDVVTALAAKAFSNIAGNPHLDDDLMAISVAAAATVSTQRKQYALKDFVYDAGAEIYWNVLNMSQHKADSVNALVPRDEWETEEVTGRNGSVRVVQVKPSSSIARIERDSIVECAAWWPGKDRIINDVLVTSDGERHAPRCRMLNTYQVPQHKTKGNAAMATQWTEHLRRLWPDDWELLLDYFAHTVQHPEIKINFGLVLVGAPGIGKDLSLNPVRAAVGNNNCQEISPDAVASNFNGWVKSVMLIVNEARPADSDFKATDFYEKLKPVIAAPPDWLLRNGKYMKQEHVRNLTRVVITTNDPLSLFVPEDDRRLYFAKSRLKSGWAESKYFYSLVAFYDKGGNSHVYEYLRQRDISKFDPKKRPAPNAAHRAATASWNQAVHDPLADVLDDLGWPDLFFGSELLAVEVAAFDNKDEMKLLLRSSRRLAVRMNRMGYEARQSPNKNGWQFCASGERFRSRVVFVKNDFAGDFEAEVDRRGHEIAEKGKAARPKVVPLKPV